MSFTKRSFTNSLLVASLSFFFPLSLSTSVGIHNPPLIFWSSRGIEKMHSSDAPYFPPDTILPFTSIGSGLALATTLAYSVKSEIFREIPFHPDDRSLLLSVALLESHVSRTVGSHHVGFVVLPGLHEHLVRNQQQGETTKTELANRATLVALAGPCDYVPITVYLS